MTPHDEDSNKNTVMQRAKNLIENEYMNDITVAEIAAVMHMDRTVFCRSFRNSYGVSPKEYLSDIRIKAACHFINSGYEPLSEVAAMCGYKEYCNFSRMFSKRVGMSPHEYKKICAEGIFANHD